MCGENAVETKGNQIIASLLAAWALLVSVAYAARLCWTYLLR